jgi:glycosyltransferase involved in cell wall biosynthesis
MISFAILVADEENEFRTLITNLVRVKDENDEIVVLIDTDKATPGIMQVIDINVEHVKYYKRSLDNDFSAQKNYLFSKCTKDYIINLDADELIYEDFIKNVKEVIKLNPDIEAFWVPRWNEVRGITDEWIQKWGWKIDEKFRINWPDLQMRILKNKPEIKWVRPVHEQLSGYKSYATLPSEQQYSIYHIKSIEKQIKQNNMYNTIVTGA